MPERGVRALLNLAANLYWKKIVWINLSKNIPIMGKHTKEALSRLETFTFPEKAKNCGINKYGV